MIIRGKSDTIVQILPFFAISHIEKSQREIANKPVVIAVEQTKDDSKFLQCVAVVQGTTD